MTGVPHLTSIHHFCRTSALWRLDLQDYPWKSHPTATDQLETKQKACAWRSTGALYFCSWSCITMAETILPAGPAFTAEDEPHEEPERSSTDIDALEAHHLTRLRLKYSHVSSNHQASVTQSTKPSTLLGILKYNIEKFWRHQISIKVDHDTCRDHLGTYLRLSFQNYLSWPYGRGTFGEWEFHAALAQWQEFSEIWYKDLAKDCFSFWSLLMWFSLAGCTVPARVPFVYFSSLETSCWKLLIRFHSIRADFPCISQNESCLFYDRYLNCLSIQNTARSVSVSYIGVLSAWEAVVLHIARSCDCYSDCWSVQNMVRHISIGGGIRSLFWCMLFSALSVLLRSQRKRKLTWRIGDLRTQSSGERPSPVALRLSWLHWSLSWSVHCQLLVIQQLTVIFKTLMGIFALLVAVDIMKEDLWSVPSL